MLGAWFVKNIRQQSLIGVRIDDVGNPLFCTDTLLLGVCDEDLFDIWG